MASGNNAIQQGWHEPIRAAGDGYVHRLVQSKTGGKLVEVPSPQSAFHGDQCGVSSECVPGHMVFACKLGATLAV